MRLEERTISNAEGTILIDGGGKAKEIKGRIYAMALVHEQLMTTKDLSVINLSTYVQKLIANLQRSFSATGSRVAVRIVIDPIDVSIDTAVPLGLVLNEIITNSLKYAFPGERTGEISVEGHLEGQKLFLKVADDGIGFSEPLDSDDQNSSLGIRIIKIVVEDQLNGTIKKTRDNGTVYEIVLNDVEIIRRV
jgi:two-component sensor histidine kinase